MQNIRRFRPLLILCACLLLAGLIISFAQASNSSSAANEYYVYPITPDDPGWDSHSPAELRELLRIPEETLDQMDSAQLVQAVFDYPYLIDLFLYSTHEQGLNALLSECDALSALILRDDAAKTLLNRLTSVGGPLQQEALSRLLELPEIAAQLS